MRQRNSKKMNLPNIAIFGKTAAQWRAGNPESKGNVRDCATLEQLVVLSNMESINALLIRQGLSQGERLLQLNSVAITQIKSRRTPAVPADFRSGRFPVHQRIQGEAA
jgi:hypothetical protein